MMRWLVLVITILLAASGVATGHDEAPPCVSPETCQVAGVITVDFQSLVINDAVYNWAFTLDSHPGIAQVSINQKPASYYHYQTVGAHTPGPTASVVAVSTAGNSAQRDFALSSYFSGRPAVKLQLLRSRAGTFQWLLRPLRQVRSLRLNNQAPRRIADRLLSVTTAPSLTVSGRDNRGRRFTQRYALNIGVQVG